jgi:two-component system, sensor histidine kinase and response regulator
MVTTNRRAWQREALDRLGGDQELLHELCQIFLEESPNLLQKLREAVAVGDPDAVGRAAHSLKGELSYLGAADASQIANRLEEMGRVKKLSHAAETLAALETEVESLRLCLKHPADLLS